VILEKPTLGPTRMFVNLVLANAILLLTALAQSPAGAPNSPVVATAKPAVSAARSRYLPNRLPKRARNFYELVWGVDSLAVKSAESGEIIRFTYRVLDANKAKALNDKKIDPFLIDEKARVKLVVPSLEKVGQLRQSSTPEAGRSYWMAFSNKGRLVRPGDRVNVVIGNFQANGLVVQ
jgi:hypothetical protein